MNLTIPDLLAGAAHRYGDRKALIASDRSLTFTELHRLAENLGDNLRALGVAPGDRVVLWLGNSWRWVVAYYGALSTGAELVPANGLLAPAEVADIAVHCRAKVLIAAAGDLDRLPLRAGVGTLVVAGASRPGAVDFDAMLEPTRTGIRDVPRSPVTPSDVAEICYTSGTIGTPKGVVLSHSSFVTGALETGQLQGKTSSDVVGTALPFCHVYGTMVLNSAIHSGARLVLLSSQDGMNLLADIERHKLTVVEAVPATYHGLLNVRCFERFDIESLRLCSVGGQAMPKSRLEEVEARLKCPVHELWGMTEIAGPGTTHSHLSRRVPGSIGLPLPSVEIRIADPADCTRAMPDKEVGELLVRGPLVMKGYLDEPAATEATITPDGWLRTGDLVRRDEHGYLCLVDRLKDVILSGGYTLYPAEIERVICAFPAVALASVVPVDDSIRGQVAKAVVTLRPGISCEPEELFTYCRQHLAKYKVPRKIEIVDTLPTGLTGKILRRELRQSAPRRETATAGQNGWSSGSCLSSPTEDPARA